MVQGYTPQSNSHPSRWYSPSTGGAINSREPYRNFGTTGSQDHDRYPHDQWFAHITQGNELQSTQGIDCKSGGVMLSVTGLNKFYFLRDFHDMRCKYDRVRSIIHRQLDREPEQGDVFIMMSKDRRLVRLYSYDQRSCSLYEKRFKAGYQFMKVSYKDDLPVYSISWEDVVVLLESPVIKTLRIK